MARSGGIYSLPLAPVEPGATVEASWANTTLDDVATALTGSLAKDGQTTPSANLPMAGFRHTGVGNATARDQYAAAGQIQDAGLITLGSVSGTNTITGSLTPAITAYATGMMIQFIPAAANTGAVTINVNSVGAKAITKLGTTALVAGDLLSGSPATAIYDGTRFILLNPAASLIQIAYKTASETVNNSATLQNDDHLSASLVASAKYVVELFLRASTDGSYASFASADLKVDFTVPSGASGHIGTPNSQVSGEFNAIGSNAQVNLLAHESFRHVVAYVETGGSAGTLQFRWAQWGATAVNTTLDVGSHMIVRRVA